jgi:hypothetical protein
MNRVQMLSWPFYLRRLCGKWYTLAVLYVVFFTEFAGIFYQQIVLFFFPLGVFAVYSLLLILVSFRGAREIFPSLNASLVQMRKHQLPILAEMRRQKGILIALALTPVYFVVFTFADNFILAHADPGFGLVSILISFVVLALVMYFTIYFLLRRDTRRNWTKSDVGEKPFVLYLRTFSVDAGIITGAVAERGSVSAIEKTLGRLFSVEKVVFRAVTTAGLAGVAVGAPREALPPLGFARLYFSDAEWQKQVSSLIQRSAVVILDSSPTHWVEWELAEIRQQAALRKLVLMTHASTPDKRIAHLSFALRALGCDEAVARDCSPSTIALVQLDKARPLTIDAYPDDLFSFLDVTTVGIYALSREIEMSPIGRIKQ